jgi:hypothetical protein
MKIVFFGESSADEAALAIFTEGIFGEPPETIDMGLVGHGVTGVLNSLDGVFRGVYYNSDAEGFIVGIDCDDTELHDLNHDKPGASEDNCRFCKASKIIAKARTQLKAKPGRPRLRAAIGLAVPAIEAWYLVGRERQVGEAAWRTGRAANKPPFTRRQLKQLVYGTDRPSLEDETKCAETEARRIIRDISAIEKAFPVGFGLMAQEVCSWKTR